MINIKGLVADALAGIVPEENLSDSFPDDWDAETQIQYTEEENKAGDVSGNKALTSYVRYRIDIWNKKSTSGLACQVDDALNGTLGLTRTGCTDSNETKRKHKIMRYEGIVNEKTKKITTPR